MAGFLQYFTDGFRVIDIRIVKETMMMSLFPD